MNPPTLHFRCLHGDTLEHVRTEFEDVKEATFERTGITQGGGYFEMVDCIMTTANSFGRMDGGVDGAVNALMTMYEPSQRLFLHRVQDDIVREYHGEQPVGTCLLVPTSHPRISFVAHAPTMRVPEDVSDGLNAYLAFRAVMSAVRRHNTTTTTAFSPIRHILCAPCCTSSGSMAAPRAAKQMRAAYASVYEKSEPRLREELQDWRELHRAHRHLRSH